MLMTNKQVIDIIETSAKLRKPAIRSQSLVIKRHETFENNKMIHCY